MANETGFSVAEFYEGSFGPNVLLRTSSVESIVRLQTLFSRLAESAGLRLDLAAEIGSKIGGVSEAIVECDEAAGDFDKSIHIGGRLKGELPDFHWRRGPSGWRWCAELMQPLIDEGPGGRQYLSQSSSDDADIEIDFVDD